MNSIILFPYIQLSLSYRQESIEASFNVKVVCIISPSHSIPLEKIIVESLNGESDHDSVNFDIRAPNVKYLWQTAKLDFKEGKYKISSRKNKIKSPTIHQCDGLETQISSLWNLKCEEYSNDGKYEAIHIRTGKTQPPFMPRLMWGYSK